MKIDLFQSCGYCWVFQICWHIECNTLTASSFQIWNSSTGILSPPLALFIVMLPKDHCLYIPGCQALGDWSHHCGYLGHYSLFLYSSSVYSCHLFLISSASVRSIQFLSFTVPVFAINVPLVSLIFLKRSLCAYRVTRSGPTLCDPMDHSLPCSSVQSILQARIPEWVAMPSSREQISSPSHSMVFFYFFTLINEEGFLISPCYFLELCIQMGISFFFSFAFSFPSFLSYLSGLLRVFCLLTFLFLGDGFDHHFLYSVIYPCP